MNQNILNRLEQREKDLRKELEAFNTMSSNDTLLDPESFLPSQNPNLDPNCT